MQYTEAVLSFVVAAVVAAALTPLAARLARRVGAIDKPRDRGLARRETPLLGGLAILAAVLVGGAIWLPPAIYLPHVHGRSGNGGLVHMWAIIAGACLITLVGAIDDWRELPPGVKLVGQIAAALVVVEGGAVVNEITLPFAGSLQFPNEGGVISVVWLVGMMNVVNFSDGIDGLAAGICTIDGAAFAVISFSLGVNGAAILAALTAGAALGFLFHNFYPASVFMGDAGANLLGYLLGVVAVVGSLKTNAVVALVVPLMILVIPFLDTSFVIAKRLKYRRKPWSADANHFHHRMSAIGFSQRKTVAYLYAWSFLMAGLAVALRLITHSHRHQTGWIVFLLALAVVCAAASIYLIYVLEIFKFKGLRTIELRRNDPDTSEHQIDESVRKDIETGEFEKIGPR
ncbi:MAG TPA: MraY family glycosyltransferase [Solirubrobacteraceae bacterium]|jgi:UDP-GlcNAc:undecaprenyl-phosphate GlcNAc-1-phosphate transferase|nr:MraY family glycosyltransferase [Solirubrobacteraceae bacterium]